MASINDYLLSVESFKTVASKKNWERCALHFKNNPVEFNSGKVVSLFDLPHNPSFISLEQLIASITVESVTQYPVDSNRVLSILFTGDQPLTKFPLYQLVEVGFEGWNTEINEPLDWESDPIIIGGRHRASAILNVAILSGCDLGDQEVLQALIPVQVNKYSVEKVMTSNGSRSMGTAEKSALKASQYQLPDFWLDLLRVGLGDTKDLPGNVKAVDVLGLAFQNYAIDREKEGKPTSTSFAVYYGIGRRVFQGLNKAKFDNVKLTLPSRLEDRVSIMANAILAVDRHAESVRKKYQYQNLSKSSPQQTVADSILMELVQSASKWKKFDYSQYETVLGDEEVEDITSALDSLPPKVQSQPIDDGLTDEEDDIKPLEKLVHPFDKLPSLSNQVKKSTTATAKKTTTSVRSRTTKVK